MDSITWKLMADGSFVRAEMLATIKSVDSSTGQMAKGFERVDSHHGKFLRSGHAVSGQIRNIARDFASGASAGDIFASSLEGIGRSLNLSLGSLAGLAVGAVAVQKISAVHEEYEKLRKKLVEVHKEASQSGDFKTLSLIEAQATKAASAVQELNDRMDDRSGKSGFWASVWQGFKDVAYDVTTGSAVENTDTTDREKGKAEQYELESQGLTKRRQRTDLKQAALAGAPDYEIKAATAFINAQENAAKGLAEAGQAFRDLNLELSQLLKARNDKALERSGVSLSEAANLPDVVDNSVSYERWKASQDAKRAIGLKGQGEAARLNMNPEAAHDLFNQSGEAAEGITGLKPSEKMSADFKGALQVTEENTAKCAELLAGKFVNK